MTPIHLHIQRPDLLLNALASLDVLDAERLVNNRWVVEEGIFFIKKLKRELLLSNNYYYLIINTI